MKAFINRTKKLTLQACYNDKIISFFDKPGIIFGNSITCAAGFALAAKNHGSLLLFIETLLGLGCIIASACVFNNYIDRDTDKKMIRTQNRPLAKGTISTQKALVFAVLLGLLGTTVLAVFTNTLTCIVALTGFIIYVLLYGFYKYLTVYGTLIGSIAGAIPPVVGYTAVTNHLDTAAFLLFLIITLWQMPHFYAIAMYRIDDYTAASIPVLPIKEGFYTTKIHMMFYVIAFTIASAQLTLFGYTGYIYLTLISLLGFSWCYICYQGFNSTNSAAWST